jgi:hypothetical protein
MMSRIKDAEHSQAVAEMRQKIAELEIENQELLTAGQLRTLRTKGEGVSELEDTIADLQEEVRKNIAHRHLYTLLTGKPGPQLPHMDLLLDMLSWCVNHTERHLFMYLFI